MIIKIDVFQFVPIQKYRNVLKHEYRLLNIYTFKR